MINFYYDQISEYSDVPNQYCRMKCAVFRSSVHVIKNVFDGRFLVCEKCNAYIGAYRSVRSKVDYVLLTLFTGKRLWVTEERWKGDVFNTVVA